MDPRLLTLVASALAGLASKTNGGHGVAPKSIEEIGREAVLLGRAALTALEELETDPSPAKPGAKSKAR